RQTIRARAQLNSFVSSRSSRPMPQNSDDDILKAGLRLLWELDVFLAVGINRLDNISEGDRDDLHAAFIAASAALAAVHPRRKHGEAGGNL
ncbi:MAG TPA: hypothetical protein VFL07_07060, partial [Rudaea sp.]|nr:hypothetical protein [Rudaea sp.]